MVSVDLSEAFLSQLFGKRSGHRERPGFYYQVKHGDSFYSLSRRFRVDVEKLKLANRVKGNILPKRRIYIPRSTFVIKPDQIYEEHPHPKPHLKNVSKNVEAKKANKVGNQKRANNKTNSSKKTTAKPQNQVKFFWPVKQPKLLTQGSFGEINGETRNAGILLECKTAEVRPSRKGKLVFQGNLDGYGKTVILDHLDDYFTIYAHLSKIKRYKEGQWISRKKAIGYTGIVESTGETALHFEVRYLNQAMDPLLFLDREELEITTINN
tara:strand:+ start:1027 stop:1827 length:801 start_codon:yes stop_codon:yes gene_type:complete